ncbi:MAG: FGGY-family carbohydrate kinase, partial [Planctomycetota bacterium]
GGAKSPFWLQLQADMFGKRVVTMTADEGPAMGVALLAAVGCGEYKSITEACKATVATASETKPAAAQHKVYDRSAPIYRGLYQSLRDDYRAIAALGP